MKPRFEPTDGNQDSDAIQSNIAQTRAKMDHTLDEISERMSPRHLLDEALNYFRSHGPDKNALKEKTGAAAQKAGDAAGQIGHAIVDTIRRHPVPALLVGAGIAWAAYERQQEQSQGEFEREDWDEDFSGEGGSTGEQMGNQAKEKLSDIAETVKGKGEQARERISRGTQKVKMKASELKHRMSERTQRSYEAGKERVLQAGDEHPLTMGLGALALGILAGIALPHTSKEDEWLGRTSDQLKNRARDQGREMMERGKHVATAAVETVKQEAAKQGITPENLREKAGQVASETKAAATEAAKKQGA